MKKLLLYIAILFASVNVWSQTINETGGWLESAFIKWTPVPGADSYNVYYTGVGKTNVQIDTQLIRSYGSYFRADLLGLAVGTYTVTVKAVIAGNENTGTISAPISVTAHDRNGFAFEGGHIPGAYNLDGTTKTGAVIVYVTQNTKNTVSLTVTGAVANPCVGLQNILTAYAKGKETRPLIVRLIGNVTDLDVLINGDLYIGNNQNSASSITFEGVGNDAVTNGWSVVLKGATNTEVRNVAAMNNNSTNGDDFGLQQDNDHIWMHNNEMFYGDALGDADQVKGDGAMDIKLSTYITVSYNHFWDNGKCSLLGLSENTTAGLYITYHHNWFDHSDSRHPRVRFYSAHVYNNYYDGNSKYGAGSTMGSSVFSEGNYYRDTKYPLLTSLQGTDVWNPLTQKDDPGNMGIFSGEDGGTIKAFNNTYDQDIATNNMRFVAYGDPTYPNSTVDFDAYVAQTRVEQVPPTVKSFAGANTYNNFDTDPTLYVSSLIIDSPIDARDKTKAYSGRTGGGDLQWTFTNATDDSGHFVIPGLKTAITNYTSPMLYVQGEPIPNPQTLVVTTSNSEQTVTLGDALENTVFTWGGSVTDASVTGLPAAGIDFVKDPIAKTITISGSPTTDVSYSVTTTGTTGTSVTKPGTIAVFIPGTALSDEIHNFTTATPTATSSSFYTFAGSMNSSAITPGTITYNDGTQLLTLTANLKLDSKGTVTYTTLAVSSLTLVLDPAFVKKVKLDGVAYTVPAGGVITIPNVPVGNHTIEKNDATYLYYIKTSFATTLGTKDNVLASKLTLYPNPVANHLYFSASDQIIENVTIYSLSGAVVKTISNVGESVDVSNLSAGSYLVKVTTDQESFTQKIIKK